MSQLAQAPVAELGAADARAICERIRAHLGDMRALVLELHDRRGWVALGYASWEACVTQEFARDRSSLFRHLQAAEVERDLNSRDVTTPAVGTYNLVALAQLEPEERLEVAQAFDLSTVSVRTLRQEIKQRRERRVVESRTRLLEAPGPALELGDAFAVELADCAHLPAYAVGADLIVTSPPYGLGVHGSDQLSSTDWPGYLWTAQSWAESMYHVLVDGGRLCLNVPLDRSTGSREPCYADWVQVLRGAGFGYETTHLWLEGNSVNHQARGSVASPNAPHGITPVEMVIVAYRARWNLQQPSRPGDIALDEWMDWLSNVWNFPGEHRHRVGHSAPFPEELARRCVLLYSFPGALVADPFVGSGTTAVAALKLGRRFRGSDIDPECVALTERRVARELA